MADRPSDSVVEARLRDFFAAELRQAESDFPHLPRPARRRARRRLPAGVLVAVAVVVGAIVVVPRFIGTSLPVSGGPEIGPDGLPLSINGEPVLRGSDIAARIGDSAPFLAGGTLVLGSTPCPSPSGASQAGCSEEWQLSTDPSATSSEVFALDKVTAAPGFVRTSGALTVVRVALSRSSSPTSAGCGAGCGGVLTVEAIAWRHPTKGPIPPNAAPAEGGSINEALVPDFVSAWGQDGVTIAGYVPKRYLVGPFGPVAGSPSNPPQDSPEPVYGEDLTTLVGYMVPGKGFVPLGSPQVVTPTPTGAPVAVGAALRVQGTVHSSCPPTEGGCAYFAELTGLGQTHEAQFSMRPVGGTVVGDAGLPAVLSPGAYTLTLTSNVASDVIVNGVRPTGPTGPEDARCVTIFTVAPGQAAVDVSAVFDTGSCTIKVASSMTPVASGEIALPTEPPIGLPPGTPVACAGIGISAVLHGDAADPHVAWLVNNLGTRINVTWPVGYRARFTPNLEVLDTDGLVVLREGAPVSGGCVTADVDVLHLEPPFK